MKWKDYTSLTPEQREEWYFRFKYKVRFNYDPGTPIYIIAIVSVLALYMCLYYQGITGTIPLIKDYTNTFKTSMVIVIILIVSYAIEVLTILLGHAYWKWREHKWLKDIRHIQKH